MCFFVPYADRYSKPLIAPEQGIDCFKVVFRMPEPGVYRSLFQGFRYRELEQQKEVPLHIKEREAGNLFGISEGYHLYSSYGRARYDLGLHTHVYHNLNSELVIARCLIPAGSQYYENLERDEYVSSSIIILGEE